MYHFRNNFFNSYLQDFVTELQPIIRSRKKVIIDKDNVCRTITTTNSNSEMIGPLEEFKTISKKLDFNLGFAHGAHG